MILKNQKRIAPKKTISKDEYLKLVGLITIAQDQNQRLNVTANVIARALGFEDADSDESGHTWDAVFGSATAKQLLKRLGVTVRR